MDNREYYQNLLIIQYHDKPKAKSTIGAMYDTIVPKNSKTGNYLITDVGNAFDLDTAVGVQLDMIGYYIGVNRLYIGQDLNPIEAFGFTDELGTDYSDVVGLSDEADFLTDTGIFLGVEELISTTNRLNDDDYRLILKLKSKQNNSNHSSSSIDDIFYEFFGNNIYMVDNLDMSMTYYVAYSYSRIAYILDIKGLFLKPMGVEANYIVEV